MSPAHDGSLTINEALELGEIEMRQPKKKKPYGGHQVATRFLPADLKKLDQLVEAEREKVRAGHEQQKSLQFSLLHQPRGGRSLENQLSIYAGGPSRSSVILDLVRGAGVKPSTKPDPRQVDLDEAIERSKLAAGVDAIEASSKNLERKSRSKKKPRAALHKSAGRKKNSPARKKQIAAANKTYRAKKKREAARR